eukprot:757429-Hanusia_phi.AAC.2
MGVGVGVPEQSVTRTDLFIMLVPAQYRNGSLMGRASCEGTGGRKGLELIGAPGHGITARKKELKGQGRDGSRAIILQFVRGVKMGEGGVGGRG